jgi:hypothetical protein
MTTVLPVLFKYCYKSTYLYTMNMKGLSYPVHTGQIDKFEMQNDVSVNGIGYVDGDFFPVYLSKQNQGHYVFTVFRLLTDFVCLYTYEF